MRKPVEIFEKLQWWLSARFGGPFTDIGCTMEHGQQSDSISCAFCTSNMITHAALDEPLWNVSRAVYKRAAWFLRIVSTHNSPVSVRKLLVRDRNVTTIISA
jgi:hypothetical protein